MYPSSRRLSRQSRQNKTKIFFILSIVGYIILGSVVLAFLFIDVWDEINENKEEIKELDLDIIDVNNTIQFYVPCLDFVCEEFPALLDVVMIWLGCWNSLNNTLADGTPIVSGVGENGQVARVCVPSVNVTNIDGNSDWGIGDLIVYDGNVSMWLKTDGSPKDADLVTLTDSGPGETLITDGVGPDLGIKKLAASTGITITDNMTNLIIENTAITSVDVTSGNEGFVSIYFTPVFQSAICFPIVTPCMASAKPNWLGNFQGGATPSSCLWHRIKNTAASPSAIVQMHCSIAMVLRAPGVTDYVDDPPDPLFVTAVPPFSFELAIDLSGVSNADLTPLAAAAGDVAGQLLLHEADLTTTPESPPARDDYTSCGSGYVVNGFLAPSVLGFRGPMASSCLGEAWTPLDPAPLFVDFDIAYVSVP